MKKVIITMVLCIFCVSPVFGFDFNGSWEGKSNEDPDLEGGIEIKKSGKSYKISRIYFQRQITPMFFSGCGLSDDMDKIKVVDKGNELEIYDTKNLKFTVKSKGKSIQVIPHISIGEEMCMGGESQWVTSKEGVDDMIKDVSNLKWKKVK